MKKALIVTTVSGFVPQFEMNNVRILQSMGYEVHYASNFYTPVYGNDNSWLNGTGIVWHQIDFVRSPLFISKNIKAYRQLRKLMEGTRFELVHCHTPMGGVITRLVAKDTKTRPVIYTAHGFHFYKGAPLINWIIYYPVEWWLSRYTDVLITINKEDYKRAQRFGAKEVRYVPGVGIDENRINNIDIELQKKREELILPVDAVVIASVGELNKNKNHEIIIKALASLQYENVYYVICGQGKLENHLKKLASNLNIGNKVIFLGYRKDAIQILKAVDIYAFPSKREGLSVSLMEAMACGLPVVCSGIRGNKDLITENCGGYLLNYNDITGFTEALALLIKDSVLRNKMKEFNLCAIKKYNIDLISSHMKDVYEGCYRL